MRKPSLSSILKALKRVEESSQAEETSQHPSVPRETLSRHPSGKPQRRFSGRSRAYLLLSATALIAGIAAYNWWTAGSAARPVAETAREVRAQLPPRPVEPAPPMAAAPARRVPPRPTPPPAPPVPEPAAGPAEAAAPVETGAPIQAPPPTSRVRPREGTAVPPVEARTPAARSASPVPERPSASRRSPARTAEDNLSRLDESKLKVMAIAWASDPSRRLAVVNGHIVKEGESVEGFSVTQIRKDDIIVNDGGQSWRVELNLKSQQ